MKKVAMALAFIVTLAIASSAHAEWPWENEGADPYAKTRAEAMKTRESAFEKLGLSTAVVVLLVSETRHPGEKVVLANGGRLEAMISKKKKKKKKEVIVHRDVVVALTSSKGIDAEKWQVSWEGKTYAVYLPGKCHNWSYAVMPITSVITQTQIPAQTSVAAPPPPEKKGDGCAEIRFSTKAESGDTVVKFPILGPDGPDVSKDPCTSIKRPGDKDFGAWVNEACPADSPWLCDFSDSERVAGQKVQLKGSVNITAHGEHVLRLPAYVAANDSKYVALLYLVRKGDKFPPYPEKRGKDEVAYHESIEYAKQRQQWIDHHSDAMAVLWFGYENAPTGKVARVYYSKEETPLDAPQIYWSWNQWIGKKKVMPVPWQ